MLILYFKDWRASVSVMYVLFIPFSLKIIFALPLVPKWLFNNSNHLIKVWFPVKDPNFISWKGGLIPRTQRASSVEIGDCLPKKILLKQLSYRRQELSEDSSITKLRRKYLSSSNTEVEPFKTTFSYQVIFSV